MSRVTTIFVFGELADEENLAKKLPDFARIDGRECGGSKVCQSAQFYAAFNYLNITEFIENLYQYPFQCLDSIQVLWKADDDEIFNIHPSQQKNP